MPQYYSLYPGFDARLDSMPLSENMFDIPEGRPRENEFIARTAIYSYRYASQNPELKPDEAKALAELQLEMDMFCEPEEYNQRVRKPI